MFDRICRRLAYLRRKLLNDLREAEKIFVWRQGITNLSDDALASLHEAMRQYGDNTLLYVRYRDDCKTACKPCQIPGVNSVQ